jgi:hypothetical protein
MMDKRHKSGRLSFSDWPISNMDGAQMAMRAEDKVRQF